MKRVYSAGGVVVLGNSILMLQKINGDWVLPKGKIEKNESTEEAASREVREEAGIKTKILSPIGETSYRFKNYWSNNHVIEKKVVWYLMRALNSNTHPQREEGFVDAKFIHVDNVIALAKYDDERDILIRALEIIETMEGE
ncbi:NUDIX hydrolase [Fusibacter tunisiensis]|uniref:8-oxo-dGTP pyrophosphatase MutT (NUDIX family) n=1 Tax=Fusibacter tunisiensis TaxID=1008308 RepID=A0ABS2MRE7_9FIRM|nr:NUDIX hydrolase [Fusibacter tunisiensis]MBM7561974.1 8-oxo-dGTP pyrophosphatase MutT (NUDIX family) [Fusibacter tunisiensis]